MIFVPEDIADGLYLLPMSSWILILGLVRQVPACLRNDFDTALNGALDYEILLIVLERATLDNIQRPIEAASMSLSRMRTERLIIRKS